MKFTTLSFSNHPDIIVPESLTLVYPDDSQLPLSEQHFLLSIPWNDEYLQLVPTEYQDFFKAVLPHLHARTTDVHTATCCTYIDSICTAISAELGLSNINKKVVTLALILHDSGWSKLTEFEVAASLGVSGLALTKSAMGPKEKHAVEGVALATEILQSHADELSLSADEINLILKAVRFHDQPEKVAAQGNSIPAEVRALVDLDHLWSFTQANFWQDIYRKGIATPQTYLDNLSRDLPTYFVTQSGRELALKLLSERQNEVSEFPQVK